MAVMNVSQLGSPADTGADAPASASSPANNAHTLRSFTIGPSVLSGEAQAPLGSDVERCPRRTVLDAEDRSKTSHTDDWAAIVTSTWVTLTSSCAGHRARPRPGGSRPG